MKELGAIAMKMDALVGNPLTLAILIGLLVAMLLPIVRRSVPRWFELPVWGLFVWACLVAVAGIHDPRTVELNNSVIWAAGQIFHIWTVAAGAALRGWLVQNHSVLGVLGAAVLAETVLLIVIRLVAYWRSSA